MNTFILISIPKKVWIYGGFIVLLLGYFLINAKTTGPVFKDFNANGGKDGSTITLKTGNGNAGENMHSFDTRVNEAPPASCTITLTPTVSGCYQSGGASKATVTVEVAWDDANVSSTSNDASDLITVTLGGQTRTINPGPASVTYTATSPLGPVYPAVGNTTIVSPQIVAFEIDANGASGSIGATIANNSGCTATAAYQAPSACLPTVCANGQTGGTVYNDFNANGVKESGETTGIPNVVVKAYDCTGSLVGTATTDVFGKYAFSGLTAASYPLRIEFGSLPTYAGMGTMNGTDGRTMVQFISAADCNVDLGVLNPTDYCQTNPRVFLPCYVYGDPQTGTASGLRDALISFDYSAEGYKDPGKLTLMATAQDVGTVWGMAYNKYTKKVFGSATIKRHAGLGPKGLGGIYVLAASGGVIDSWDVDTDFGINVGSLASNTARGLSTDPTLPSADPQAFTAIGTMGIGDLEISEDGNKLWFVNMYDKKLYSIDITAYNTSGTKPTAANVASFSIPNPGCAGGNARPFATKVYQNKIYVGMVCDAFTSQNKSDLRGYVYSYDPSTSTWTNIFNFPLTYPKGFAVEAGVGKDITGWYPWTDDFNKFIYSTNPDLAYPQPILTDIEFDIDGSMILAFGDRTGFQTGYANYDTNGQGAYSGYNGGDVVRAGLINGVFVLENDAKVASTTGTGPGNNQGIGFGEFYNDNFVNYYPYYAPDFFLGHSENVIGGLALRPGSGEVAVTTMDPVNSLMYPTPAGFDYNSTTGPAYPDFNTAGLRYLNNATGQLNRAIQVYRTSTYSADFSLEFKYDGGFGKSTGLGDVELGCSLPAYLEIGNRVWNDVNKNGVQDPCEKSLKDVNVTLYKGAAKIASTKTDVNGEYYFSAKSKLGSGWIGTGADTTLLASTAYKLIFGEGQFAGGQLTVAGLGQFELTVKDATANNGNDQNDSDVEILSGALCINLTTGTVGSVNHTFDAGFYCNNSSIKATFTQTAATCSGLTPNNNGKVTLTAAVTPYDKFRARLSTSTWGTDSSYATATAIGAAFPKDLITNAPNAGATYVVRFYVGECCYKDTTILVQAVDCNCVKPSAGIDQTVCAGEIATLTGTAPTTGTWSAQAGNPAGATLSTSTAGVATVNFATTAAGTYKFIYNIYSSCEDTMSIVVNAKPVIADGAATICAGEAVDLTTQITGYAGLLSPVWTVGTAGGTAVTTPTAVKPTVTTTYVLVAENAAGCKDTANVVVTVNSKPDAGADQTLACADPATNTLTTSTTLVPATAGGTWTQIGTAPAVATIAGNAVSGMSAAGTYQFQYSVAGCLDTVAVTVQPCSGCVKPDAGPDAAAVCQPTATAKLTAVTSGGSWAPQAGNPSAAGIDASGNITGLSAAGTYTFIYSVTMGGQTCTDTAQVVVNAKPVIADGATTICAGLSVDLTTQITNYATYQNPVWTAAGSSVATPTSVSPASTTTYVLVAENAAGCKDTANVVVTVNSKPDAGADQTLACADPATNTLTTSTTLVPVTAGGTWTQIGTAPAVATIAGNAVSGMSAAGTYQFQYSVAGCLDTIAVTVQPCSGCVKPDAGPDAAAVCQPTATAKLTAVTSGGSWAPQAGNPSAAGIDASGNITGLSAAGTYTFIYSVTMGGQTCTDTAQVVVNAKPTIANGTATICAGAVVDLTTQITGYAGLLSPVWTVATAGGTAVTTPTAVKPTVTTTYVLVAENAAGCKDTANVVVTVNSKPDAGADQTLACADPATNTLTTSTTLVPVTAGGTWTQIGTTPTVATIAGNAVSGMSAAGTYQFVYTLNGCKDTVAVTVQPCSGCVKPDAGPDAAAVCQPTATAKLTAVTSGGSWAPQAGNPSAAGIDASGNITGLSAAGTYTFIYSVTMGGQTCTDTAQVVVNAKPTIANGTATICAGAVVDLTAQITGYATYLSPVWTVATAAGTAVSTPASVSPASTTTYVLVAQNAAGCKDTANVVVTVNPKPNAGADQTLACANVAANTLTTSTTLVPGPAGGTWAQIGTTPAAAILTGNNVTGMSAAGTYQFVYTLNGCKDTVAVTVQPCTGCVKPNAGSDQTLICTAGSASSTATLTGFAPAGGSWTAQSNNPANAIVTNAGAVSGMSAPGTYRFIYSVTSGGQTCRDTVAVIVPNCNCTPPVPTLVTSSFTVCIGDTFPTLKATVVGLATVEWFTQATGGTAVFMGLNYKPSGTVPAGGAVFYAQARSTDPSCPVAISSTRVMATINAQDCTKEVDLALKKSINAKIAKIGDVLTYTLKVWNESNTNATGVEVTDSIATTVQFQTGSFTASRGSASISGNVIKWTIGNIAAAGVPANGDTVTLTYQVKAIQEGVHFNTAEISKTNEKDVDSTPNNGKTDEDDIDRQCFTVPVKLCPGNKVQASIPATYTNVQWFKNGGSTPIASGNKILLIEPGIYTYKATNQTCPAEGCCPIIIEPGSNCCPEDICIPFTIKKIKK